MRTHEALRPSAEVLPQAGVASHPLDRLLDPGAGYEKRAKVLGRRAQRPINQSPSVIAQFGREVGEFKQASPMPRKEPPGVVPQTTGQDLDEAKRQPCLGDVLCRDRFKALECPAWSGNKSLATFRCATHGRFSLISAGGSRQTVG